MASARSRRKKERQVLEKGILRNGRAFAGVFDRIYMKVLAQL